MRRIVVHRVDQQHHGRNGPVLFLGVGAVELALEVGRIPQALFLVTLCRLSHLILSTIILRTARRRISDLCAVLSFDLVLVLNGVFLSQIINPVCNRQLVRLFRIAVVLVFGD